MSARSGRCRALTTSSRATVSRIALRAEATTSVSGNGAEVGDSEGAAEGGSRSHPARTSGVERASASAVRRDVWARGVDTTVTLTAGAGPLGWGRAVVGATWPSGYRGHNNSTRRSHA